MKLTRMWIDQPGAFQTFHKLHGKNVLVEDSDDIICRIYFTEGDVISQLISRHALSKGWK